MLIQTSEKDLSVLECRIIITPRTIQWVSPYTWKNGGLLIVIHCLLFSYTRNTSSPSNVEHLDHDDCCHGNFLRPYHRRAFRLDAEDDGIWSNARSQQNLMSRERNPSMLMNEYIKCDASDIIMNYHILAYKIPYIHVLL